MAVCARIDFSDCDVARSYRVAFEGRRGSDASLGNRFMPSPDRLLDGICG